MKTSFLIGILLTILLGTSRPATARQFSLGSDFQSRYIWRGTDFGESMSVQPSLSFEKSGFAVASWASYSVSADGAGANEHDLIVSYTVPLKNSGSLSVGVTDYFFPSPAGLGFFDFDGDGNGAHWIEPFLSYTGPETFAVSLMAAAFVHNDPDNSLYLQASVPMHVDGVSVDWVIGAVAGKSAFYGTSSFSVVQTGITVSKEVPLTDRFSLPVSVSYLLNPVSERTFLVFGISL